MDLSYQRNLLRFLVQINEGKKYIPFLDDDIFDLFECQVLLQVLQHYLKKYKGVPSKTVLTEYTKKQLDEVKAESKIRKDTLDAIEDIYEPINKGDIEYIKETLKDNAQNALIDEVFLTYSEGGLQKNQLFAKIQQIRNFFNGYEDDAFFKDGSFLIKDRHKHTDDLIEGNPTFLHKLNNMAAAKGFYSPQLVIWMSAPKHFKTGLIIKMWVEYVRHGFNVYYADAENFSRSIRNRSKMCMMECTLPELFKSEMQDELENVMKSFSKYGAGDMYIDNYPAGVKSINDVRDRLQHLKEKHDFEPDIIVYDSIDHFIPSKSEDRKSENRLKITAVYHEAIALNKEKNCFAFAPSQVNRKAVGKKTFDMRDIGEDFGKIANAHSVFAICGTEEEIEIGYRRIVPVAQREGLKPGTEKAVCVVEIDEERMKVTELDEENYEMG